MEDRKGYLKNAIIVLDKINEFIVDDVTYIRCNFKVKDVDIKKTYIHDSSYIIPKESDYNDELQKLYDKLNEKFKDVFTIDEVVLREDDVIICQLVNQ